MELLKNDKVEENIVELEFKVPADEFETAISKVFRKANADITVPGFRKGKAPRSVVEKMYGAEMFFNDAIDELLPQAYEDAVKEAGLKVVARPEIEVTEVSKEDGFTVKAKLTTYPVVTIGEYKGLKAEKKAIEVTDEVIAGELENMQNRNARLVSVDDRAAQNGDIANIDFEGFVDGVAFEGGKGENYPLTIGSHSFIDNFEEQLIGMNIGEEKEINVTFPEEYHAPDLAGKDAVFTVTVKAIKEKELPELDDEFAAEVSEFETLEDYKADIKEKIRDRKKEAANTERENKIVDAAVEAATMDIPEAMIEEQVQQMTDEFAQRLSYQGLSMEQYLMFSGMDAQKFADDLKPQAVKRIETRLVLEAIAKAEDITASEEDFKAELEKMAGMYQMETEQLEKIIQGAQKDQMMDDIAVQKAVDFLVGEAK